MSRQLVLIGGGHAHMVTLARLESFIQKGFGVTVIQPSEYHYYSGMGPGMLGGTYRPEEIRFATRKRVEEKGGNFILGKALRIDPYKQIVLVEEGGEGGKKGEIEIAYDVLSCNAGSYVPRQLIDEASDSTDHIFTAKPIEELFRAREQILALSTEQKITIAVVGSGPSSIELAGNIHQLCKEKRDGTARILLFSGRHFMSGKPRQVRRLTRKLLERKGIEIIEGRYVKRIEKGRLLLENGQDYQADIIFPAVGVKPSPIFVDSNLPVGQDGGLLVNEFLQSTDHSNIFGGGDCISFSPKPLDKVGVYAVRQNEVLYGNLLAALKGQSLQKFSPGGSYLLIYNLGGGEGVFSKWFITFSGKLAFTIKDYIDRKFITTFQNC